MESLTFAFSDRASVPVFIGRDVQMEVLEHLLELQADKILLVTEQVVDEMHGTFFDPFLDSCKVSGDTGAPGSSGIGVGLAHPLPVVEKKVLPSGDSSKSWEHLTDLMRWNFSVCATKKTVVVAFGGGALLNVAGLFASIAFRGMKLVYLPTTLLAMHDVVTSLKTSICFDGRKNNIGSFYAPTKILIDVAFCRTLPKSELMSGLGELAKNAALFGGAHAEGFVAALSKESIDNHNAGSGEEFSLDDGTILALVRLGIMAKMDVLLGDAYEKQSGMIFEYGHTVSHALEKAYGDVVIPHGLGVTYGMLSSSFAAEKLGIMSPEARREHDALCQLLTCRWPLPEPKPCAGEVMALAMRDSKRGITSEAEDEISDVLLRRIGDIVPVASPSMLSKFPCALVREWLLTMGFPDSQSVKTPVRDSAVRGFLEAGECFKGGGSGESGGWSSPMHQECEELLAKMLHSSDQELTSAGIELLEAGFANRVCATELQGRAVVSKRYTDLVFLRIEREAIGVVDVHAGRHCLGPHVIFSGTSGLVEERLPGRTLGEADMHKGDRPMLACVAKALSAFHRLPVPSECEGEPMLWRTIDKMLLVVEERPELMPEGVPDIRAVREEVAKARSALESHCPSVVLGHGDCKPSNVILTKEEPCQATLIDFELGGPNYRGFDLFKIFRTGLPFSHSSMEHFVRVYAEDSDVCTGEVPALLAEIHLFEPLTWLEAAIFFLTLPQFKPQETERWHALAVDRWAKYTSTRSKLF